MCWKYFADPIVNTPTMQVYVIGSDFCIDPTYRGTVTIQCEIFNFGMGQDRNMSVARAFPTPDRSWSLDGDLLDRAQAGDNFDLRSNPDFFMESDRRMVLNPDFFIPGVLVAPTGGNLQGGIQFNFVLSNTTMLMTVASIDTIDEARAEAYLAVVGEWTCQANNSFGSDTATSNVRLCGMLVSLLQAHHTVLTSGCTSLKYCVLQVLLQILSAVVVLFSRWMVMSFQWDALYVSQKVPVSQSTVLEQVIQR